MRIGCALSAYKERLLPRLSTDSSMTSISSFANLQDFEITWGKPVTRLAQHFPVAFGNEVPQSLLPYHLNLSPHDKFINLTRFALKAHDYRLNIKMDQLLEILGGSPTLQHLELEGLYFDFEDNEFYYDDDDDDPDSEKIVLQLPHLQFLSLKQCLSGAFLPRIDVPATTNVVLSANDPFQLDYGDIHAEPLTILHALPPHFEELSFVGKFQTLDFRIRDPTSLCGPLNPVGSTCSSNRCLIQTPPKTPQSKRWFCHR